VANQFKTYIFILRVDSPVTSQRNSKDQGDIAVYNNLQQADLDIWFIHGPDSSVGKMCGGRRFESHNGPRLTPING